MNVHKNNITIVAAINDVLNERSDVDTFTYSYTIYDDSCDITDEEDFGTTFSAEYIVDFTYHERRTFKIGRASGGLYFGINDAYFEVSMAGGDVEMLQQMVKCLV